MDVLTIIELNLEEFRVCNMDLPESFKLSQICSICFKMTDTLSLNKLVFQDRKLQDILETTTSCLNFKGLLGDSEEIISSCHVCLRQLLTSHLFLGKVQKAHELFKNIVGFGANDKDNLEESENLSQFNEQENANVVKVEVVIETEPLEAKPDYSDTDNRNDDALDPSDCESISDKEKPNDDIKVKEKVTRASKKKEKTKKRKTRADKVADAGITKKKRPRTAHLSKKCEICSKVFTKHYRLNYHMMYVHSKEARYECEICAKRFSWPDNLKRHMLIHTGEKPHVCAECGKGFIRKTQLIDHEHQHTGEKLTCEFCGTKYKTISTLTVHMRNAHTGNGERKLKPIQSSKICDVCGKILSTKGALNTHMLTHGEKQFNCNFCDRKFVSKVLLNGHTRIHTGEKPFACEVCGKTFRTAPPLRQHKLVHAGEKPHSCHLCSKKFRQRSHLHLHLRVHANIREFVCDYCDKRFLTNGNLTQHKRIHADVRPFACEFCGKTFTATNNLKKHRATHQQGLASRPTEQEGG